MGLHSATEVQMVQSGFICFATGAVTKDNTGRMIMDTASMVFV